MKKAAAAAAPKPEWQQMCFFGQKTGGCKSKYLYSAVVHSCSKVLSFGMDFYIQQFCLF